jgi:hypothetical protein
MNSKTCKLLRRWCALRHYPYAIARRNWLKSNHASRGIARRYFAQEVAEAKEGA